MGEEIYGKTSEETRGVVEIGVEEDGVGVAEISKEGMLVFHVYWAHTHEIGLMGFNWLLIIKSSLT